MKKHLILLLSFCFLFGFSQITTKPVLPKNIKNINPQKAVFIEEVKKSATDNLSLAYKKFKLPNGLTIIVHEDHSDPVAYVDVTYHVGSSREQQGRSGFAHFFEHMMFQGSKHVADEDHFKIITDAGGNLNGTTNRDRTNYFETVPSNQVEVMLWLEADRMGFLLDSVTQKKFEVQRATVKNERGQRYENSPYGLGGEKIGEAMYPANHPYSWQTIGYIEDLNRVDVNDLKRFYMRWYGPNNATLTICGDVNTDDVVKLAEKYFGSIPPGPLVNKMAPAPAKLDSNRYISYEDNVRFPQLILSYPTVEANHKDETALEALGWILSHGKTSPFYINFRKNQKAVAAFARNGSTEIAGEFEITILSNPGATLKSTEGDVMKLLQEWENKANIDEPLVRYKSLTESDIVNRLSTVQSKGATLAANQTFTGNPNYLTYKIAQLKKLTKEDIMRVFVNYIKNKPHVILSVVPIGKKELVAAADNWKMSKREVEAESAEYKNLKYSTPIDNFDRALKPKPSPAPHIHVPEFWTNNFENGVKIIGTYSDEIPKIRIQISLRAGHRFEAMDKSGVSLITANLLNEATLTQTAEQIDEELDKLGAHINVDADADEITISLTSMVTNIDATLKLMQDVLLKPKFAIEDFERAKKQAKDAINQRSSQATAIADRVFNTLLYGKDHIMSIPTTGTIETIEKITLEDVKKFYSDEFSPQDCHVVVSGQIKQENILPKLDFLKTWKATAVPEVKFPTLPTIDKTRIYFVDKKEAAQSEIRIGFQFLPFDATGEFYKATIMNFAFGGSFNSRLNLLLREKRGFTYGIRANFNGNMYNGNYAISGGIKSSVTDSAIIDCMNELKKYLKDGITEEELTFTKHAINQADAIKFEAPQAKAGFVKRVLEYNLPADYVQQQIKIMDQMTISMVNDLAKKHLKADQMIILIVGDKEKNLEKVKKIGYEVVELDKDGNIVK